MKKNLFVLFLLCLACPVFAGLEEKISLDFRDTDVREVLKVIAKQGDMGIVTEKSVRGMITISLKNVAIEEALGLVTKATGCIWMQRGSTLFITSKQLIERQLEVVELRHIAVDDAAKILSVSIFEDLKIATEPDGGSLVLNGSPIGIAQARTVLEKIDVPVPYVSAWLKITKAGKTIHNFNFVLKTNATVELKEHLKHSPEKSGDKVRHSASAFDAKISAFNINNDGYLEGELDVYLNCIELGEGKESVRNFSCQFKAKKGVEEKILEIHGHENWILSFSWK